MNLMCSRLGGDAEAPMIVYCAICASNYPERTPLQGPSHLLWEMRANLTFPKELCAFMKSVIASTSEEIYGKFGENARVQNILQSLSVLHGIDRFAAVDDALSQLKAQMTQNITHVLDNSVRLNELEEKSIGLEKEAEKWHARTKKVASSFWCQSLRNQFLLAFIIAVMVIVIVMPIALTTGKTK